MDFDSLPKTLKKSNSKSRVGKLSNNPVSTTNSAGGGGTQPYLPLPFLSSSGGGPNIIVHTT